MNRHVQFPGVRKWAGDHLAELQSEPLQVLDRFFGQFGPYVLQGCEVTPAADGGNLYDVAPGLVVLAGKDRNNDDAVMVVPFAGATDFPLPIYLTLAWDVRRREYVSGGVKPIAYDYYAEGSTVRPAAGIPYLILNDKTPRFVDVIQDTKHSFVTEAEREKWNRLLPTLIEYVDECFATFDPTAIGELRHFSVNQTFGNDDYLLCDGSIVEWGDYPNVGFPIRGLGTKPQTTGLTQVFGFCGNGNLWVINGIASGDVHGSYRLKTSPDLTNWTQRIAGNNQAGSVRHIEGNWFFIPLGVASWGSVDGISWTQMNIRLLDIIKVGNKWIVASTSDSSNATIQHSTNLTNWTQVASFASSNMLVKLAHGNGRTFVINPSPMVCRYSDDLVSWRDVVLPLASGETIYNIAYGNNKWIITTSLGNLLISTNNGTTWEKELSIFGVVNGRISIAVLEHVWVMVLPGKNVALSTDNANSWFFDPNFIIPNVSSSNYGKIEKEGNDVILYSEDGFNVGNNALRIRIRRVLPNIEDAANTKVYIRVTK